VATGHPAEAIIALAERWGGFHEVLEAQSVNPRILADPLFNGLVDAHERFAALRDGADPAVERLGRLWRHVQSGGS
jgi:hypothetical protein